MLVPVRVLLFFCVSVALGGVTVYVLLFVLLPFFPLLYSCRAVAEDLPFSLY